ncbi:MAG: 6-bladed beta-propeller [Bacteroidales bacterium]|nr:6-bladed beta-propeller [Bacteroidales bacterium]
MNKFFCSLRYFGMALMLGCAVACSENKTAEHTTIDMIGAVNNAEPVMLSEYASAIEYLPLELKDSAYLFSSMYMLETEGSYVFHTGNKVVNVAFYEFDKSGKYLRSVGTRGRAYGEYVHHITLCYDAQNKNYGQLDRSKFLIYNSEGRVVADTPLKKFRFLGFPRAYFVNGNYIVSSVSMGMVNGEMTYKDILIRIDPEGQLLEDKVLSDTPIKTSIVSQGFGGSGGISRSGNGLMIYCNDTLVRMYRENNSDTIRCLNPTTFEPHNYYLLKGNDEGVFMHKFSFMENEDIIFMEVLKSANYFPDLDENSPRKFPLIYDKSKSAARALVPDQESGTMGFVNDLDGGIPFWPSYISGNKMFRLIDAEEFIELAAKSSSAKMKSVAENLNDESNPVLVIVTLK